MAPVVLVSLKTLMDPDGPYYGPKSFFVNILLQISFYCLFQVRVAKSAFHDNFLL